MVIHATPLQQAQVLRLRDDLEDMAQNSMHIPYNQTLQMAITSCHVVQWGSLISTASEEVVAVLHSAGVVLRHHDTVYLRPAEIAELVMQLLPGGMEDSTRKLQKVEEELALLTAQNLKHDTSARRWTNGLLSVGFVILASQLGAFIWLTWWELSWDVMEPFGYVIQLFYSLVAYSYFMATRGVFDLDPMRRSWHMHFKKRSAREERFDEGRYEHLHRLRDRYRRHVLQGAATGTEDGTLGRAAGWQQQWRQQQRKQQRRWQQQRKRSSSGDHTS
ncbi:MAG: hypothetical protein WDW38_006817 [Sanguina aurantia]